MTVIICDSTIEDKVRRDIALNQYESDHHEMLLFRDEVKLPRIGEKIKWFNKCMLLVKSIEYEYGRSTSNIDDMIYIFGEIV